MVAFAAAMMFFGVQQLRHTAVDVFPEFAPPKVEVQTPSLGLSANQVEALVTIPLEQVAHTLSAGQTLTLQVVASTANYENFGSFGVLDVAGIAVSLPTITDAVARTAAPAPLSA